MLSSAPLCAVLPVKDMAAAKKYYEETLGFSAGEENPGGLMYTSGSSKFLIYQTEFAGTNKATAATWVVDDVAAEVSALKAKGVAFEHYDLPGMTLEGDVHIMGTSKAAWFVDPDGNILCIASKM